MSAWGGMPPPINETGPLAIAVYPSGVVQAERLPEPPGRMAATLAEIIGGHFSAIGGDDWVGYLDADPDRRGLAPNVRATEIAADLGWFAITPFSYLLGVVVFLGRDGAAEVDVPARVTEIAARAAAAAAWITLEIALPGEAS